MAAVHTRPPTTRSLCFLLLLTNRVQEVYGGDRRRFSGALLARGGREVDVRERVSGAGVGGLARR